MCQAAELFFAGEIVKEGDEAGVIAQTEVAPFNRTVAAAAGREFAFVKTYGYPETSHLLFDEKPQQRNINVVFML